MDHVGPVVLVLNTLRLKIPYELHQNWCIKTLALSSVIGSHLFWTWVPHLLSFHIVVTTKTMWFSFISEYRDNFRRLEKFVMIGGPNDTVITPWQSAHLGFYDQNEVVQPFEKQPVSEI